MYFFFTDRFKNYISLGVTELFFPNWNRKSLFPLRRPLLQNLIDPTPKPYRSNSKTLNIYATPPPSVAKCIFQNYITSFSLLGITSLKKRAKLRKYPWPPTLELRKKTAQIIFGQIFFKKSSHSFQSYNSYVYFVV